jgi:predicted ATPase/class 3 adenylate cyclase
MMVEMRELPSGTVTLLFSDVEGSTGLVQSLGEGYAGALADHRNTLRTVFARHGGVEVDTQGDSFFVAFAAAAQAVAAARDVQERLANGPMRVRIGVHTGEPVPSFDGYVGIDVHRAARIMSAGHGGQVVISETTRALLDPSVELLDLGEHRLKDLGAPQHLYQLGRGRFPPLRALYRTNLPVQLTPLVGRARELAEAGSLLRSERLLTLTGPGGSGKTRLGLQLAAEGVEEFPDGAFWVPLQALRDPQLVEGSIASSVGADEGLARFIGDKRLLLVLDNFEQVMAAAPRVSWLIAATPNVRVLVTSREPLNVEGERRYSVEPLPESDAEVLFIERARAVDPEFGPSPVIADICRRLDGLPLAVELAAARVVVLAPDELLARLDRRLPLLSSRSRDAPERQRTLRATIEWSYELLDPESQALFRRLAVFPGSFSLEAAEVVCEADLDSLESLVLKSLVRRRADGRFVLLETIREYALDRTEDRAEQDGVSRRHAQYFLGVARSANLNAGLINVGAMRFDIANLEQYNVRAALTWAMARGEAALAMEIAAAMEQFWVTNDASEGTRLFASVFQMPGGQAVPKEIRGHALRSWGSSAFIAGEPALAEHLWKQSLAEFEQLGDEHGRAVLLHRLGISAMVRGDLDGARALLDASHEIHERTSDVWGQTQTIGTLGAVARDAGDAATAFELIERSAQMALEGGVLWWHAGMLAELACLLLDAGRIDEGEAQARRVLELAQEQQDRPGRIFGVGLMARVASERDQNERAGFLWAAVEDEAPSAPLGGWARHRDDFAARIIARADDDFERGRSRGHGLPLVEAVAVALEPTDPRAGGPPPPG